jgi:hypothetical protein
MRIVVSSNRRIDSPLSVEITKETLTRIGQLGRLRDGLRFFNLVLSLTGVVETEIVQLPTAGAALPGPVLRHRADAGHGMTNGHRGVYINIR